MVAASWRRPLDDGINAEHSVAPITLSSTDWARYRGEHRLSRVFLILHDVLGRIREGCGCVMAPGDEKGSGRLGRGDPGRHRVVPVNLKKLPPLSEPQVRTISCRPPLFHRVNRCCCPAACLASEGKFMRLSTRNQLSGVVTDVRLGAVMASVKVKLDDGEQIVTASITREAVEELGLAAGVQATVLVKSTEVMLGVE